MGKLDQFIYLQEIYNLNNTKLFMNSKIMIYFTFFSYIYIY